MVLRSGTHSSTLVTDLVVGAVLELTVGPVAHGGHCVARHENRVVFVRHALPGERVRARITEVRVSYLRADATEVLAASPDRVVAPCPYAGPDRCGGCDFQHATPEAQRRLKSQVLREQLVRIGGLTGSAVAGIEVEPLPGDSLGWRTRVQYAVDDAGRAGLRKHRSHEVVPIDRCRIAAPDIQAAPVTSRRWPGKSGVETVLGADGEITVYTRRERGSAEGLRVVHGSNKLVERAVGRQWTIAPDEFWQVHPAAADTFADCVLEMLDPRPGERAWDLYGGAGLFAAALAQRVGPTGQVRLVESDYRTSRAGNLADLPQVRVMVGKVEQMLGRPGLRQADVVVLDPPRAGAGERVVRRIAMSGPRAVAYVACDPAALARDVKTFRAAGWRLARVRAFDAFPMTHHMECIALLTP